MRTPRLLSLLALAACGGGGGIEPATAPPRILTSGTTYEVSVANESDAGAVVIRAAPEIAWIALPGVFQALEIAPKHIDSGQKIMGNVDHSVRRRLGGEPLSIYLNCGSSMSGPIANNYDVKLSVISQLHPAEEGRTLIRSRVAATARSREGTSSSSVQCGTTGRLEARIAELLNRSVGQ